MLPVSIRLAKAVGSIASDLNVISDLLTCRVQVTHWVIADIGSPKGQALVHSALKYVASSRSAQARAALIHCGSEGETVPNAARLLPAALDMASEEDHPFVTAFLTELFGPDGLQARQVACPTLCCPGLMLPTSLLHQSAYSHADPSLLLVAQMMAQPADDMMAFQSAVAMAEQAGLDPEKLMVCPLASDTLHESV